MSLKFWHFLPEGNNGQESNDPRAKSLVAQLAPSDVSYGSIQGSNSPPPTI